MRWPGAHVMITGGSRGIGEAIAREVLRRGARVTVLARGKADLDRIRSDLGPDVHAGPLDVRDHDAVHAASDAAAEVHGPVDVLVCSAGISRPGRFLELDDRWFTELIEVDYYGTLWPIRAVAPSMVERGHGSIVGMCSAAGLVGVYGYAAYGAAKFAVRGLLEAVRTELAPAGVHVALCYPPDVDTSMLRDEEPFKPAETSAIAGTIRPITATQVARAVVRGVERGTPEIYADTRTRMLARTVATVPGAYRRYFDRIVRRTAPERDDTG